MPCCCADTPHSPSTRHRIHSDLDYVTKEEGYPGLIVHGPLIATLLLDSLRRAKTGCAGEDFSFRAIAPNFPYRSFAVHGRWPNRERHSLGEEIRCTDDGRPGGIRLNP